MVRELKATGLSCCTMNSYRKRNNYLDIPRQISNKMYHCRQSLLVTHRFGFDWMEISAPSVLKSGLSTRSHNVGSCDSEASISSD
jgi:hypothetical protein